MYPYQLFRAVSADGCEQRNVGEKCDPGSDEVWLAWQEATQRLQPQTTLRCTALHSHVTSWVKAVNLTVIVGRVLVEADPVVVAVVSFVTAEQVASVHLVEPARAFRDTGLLEAALGVLALSARDNIALPGPQEVAAGRQVIVVRMRLPERDNHVVGVLASLPDAALVTSGVLEAQVGAAAAGVVVPAAVGDTVVCGDSTAATRCGG